MGKREWSPITGQFAQADKIQCQTCAFRDRTVVHLGGKDHPCGITRDTCEVYKGPPYKPTPVLFQGAPCQYYTEATE